MDRLWVAVLLQAGLVIGGLASAAETTAQDYVIKEGSGLSGLYLGMTSEQAIAAKGEPDLNLYEFIFVHNLPDGTVLSYRIDDDHVVAINLKGDSKSKYTTLRGVKLGMHRNKIKQIYGAPEAEAVNKVFYHSQGIDFFFNDDILYEISVVPQNNAAPLRH